MKENDETYEPTGSHRGCQLNDKFGCFQEKVRIKSSFNENLRRFFKNRENIFQKQKKLNKLQKNNFNNSLQQPHFSDSFSLRVV